MIYFGVEKLSIRDGACLNIIVNTELITNVNSLRECNLQAICILWHLDYLYMWVNRSLCVAMSCISSLLYYPNGYRIVDRH